MFITCKKLSPVFTLSGILFAGIFGNVTCDYDTNRGDNMASRSLESSDGMCTGSSCLEGAGNGISGAMWFGPRLGRRRRSGDKTASSNDDDEIDAIADAINQNILSLVSYQGDKRRQATQFTPRLGRELTDNFLQKYMGYADVDRLDNNQGYFEGQQRQVQSPPPPPPFAPRLGRHLPFIPSPRLGRQLNNFLRKI